MPQVCRKCRVSGKVQGVFFRATTAQRANELGITGYARNESDGSVEVLACGESAVVDRFCEWLWEGSAYASVVDVKCESVDCEMPGEFRTL